MQWVTDESGLFHTLAAPDIKSSNGTRAMFPFGGKGDHDSVRILMLRVSHNQLYKLILTHICATKVSSNDKGKTFLVRGPPGTGKSVMLNLIWYVAIFELGMNVICHMGDGDIHLYHDDDKTKKKIVSILDRDGVRYSMVEPNTVYLFDPNEANAQPVYNDNSRGINVIATSPHVKHYECIMKSADSTPKSLTTIPLWSYAWTHEEIIAGLKILGKPVSDVVKMASETVFGNFRFALHVVAGRGKVTSASATKILKRMVDKIHVKHFNKLVDATSYESVANFFCTDGTVGAFQLSHFIVTQIAPTTLTVKEPAIPEVIQEYEEAQIGGATAFVPETTLELDPVILDDPIDLPAVIQECKRTQTKEDATSLLKAWEKSLEAA